MGRSIVVAMLAASCLGMGVCVEAAYAEPTPPAVAAMIDAAAKTGDPAALQTVSDLAKKTNPNSAAEIDAQVAALRAAAEQARVDKLTHQGLLQGIKGEGQIGFASYGGNSNTTSLTLGLNLSKETLHWKHTITLSADYEKSAGVLSQEKYLASYEGNYNISDRLYALLDAGWDRDRFAGYDSREGGSLGVGYKLLNGPRLTLSAEAGPAIRETSYLATPLAAAYNEQDVGGRVAGNFAWNITPTTVFTENATGFLDSRDKTLKSDTAITTKLIGALSARASYSVQYDSKPPVGVHDTDTISRLTMVYGF